jgi:hypothetical protein
MAAPNVDNVFYPHGLYLNGGTAISCVRDFTPSNNFRDLSESPAGQAAPMFTGTHDALPDLRFGSMDVKVILDAMLDSAFYMSSGVKADSPTKIEFKAGTNAGIRNASGDNSHISASCARVALFLESIRCRQGECATVQCRLVTLFDTAGSVDPMVFSNGVDLVVTAAIPALWTIGPVTINSADAGCIEEWELNNNIEYEEVQCAGLPFCTYVGIKSTKPQLKITTNKVGVITTYGTRGTALSSVTAFLRKKLASGINVANATAEHLKFVGTAGTIKARSVAGSKAMAELTIDFAQSAEDTAPYAYTASVAIV